MCVCVVNGTGFSCTKGEGIDCLKEKIISMVDETIVDCTIMLAVMGMLYLRMLSLF